MGTGGGARGVEDEVHARKASVYTARAHLDYSTGAKARVTSASHLRARNPPRLGLGSDPKEADGFVGMLIDLDLAKILGSKPSGARHKTGTMQFIAIKMLRGINHTYRHNLESFFYVLL